MLSFICTWRTFMRTFSEKEERKKKYSCSVNPTNLDYEAFHVFALGFQHLQYMLCLLLPKPWLINCSCLRDTRRPGSFSLWTGLKRNLKYSGTSVHRFLFLINYFINHFAYLHTSSAPEDRTIGQYILVTISMLHRLHIT